MEELPEAVAFADPITAVFELNEEMLKRSTRIGYIVEYALWAGVIITIISGLGSLVLWLSGEDITLRVLAAVALVISPIVAFYARRERRFLGEYRVRSGAVNRAKSWQPDAPIPEGPDPLSRFLDYLRTQDERFAYLVDKRPKRLARPAEIWGRSKETHDFDAYFEGSPWPWDSVQEGVRILIRTAPKVTLDILQSMREDAEDVLAQSESLLPARVILLQTELATFSDEIVDFANENWVEYERRVGSSEWDWESPVELVAESPKGTYTFGSVNFG
ncbi:MAG: hypothetical protein ACE5KH_06810 [Candidatus Geothermarchaeales archaeon]